jgi:hypothetical protein
MNVSLGDTLWIEYVYLTELFDQTFSDPVFRPNNRNYARDLREAMKTEFHWFSKCPNELKLLNFERISELYHNLEQYPLSSFFHV